MQESKRCIISFDRLSREYLPGEEIKGEVQYMFEHEEKIKGIYIRFMGAARSDFFDPDDNIFNKASQIAIVDNNDYLHVSHFLVGGKTETSSLIVSGLQIYPFSCLLPKDLPSSFEGNYGHVRYLAVVGCRRTRQADEMTEQSFVVIRPFDFTLPQHLSPVDIEIHQIYFCYCCSVGSLMLNIQIPRSYFYIGTFIPIDIHCDNDSIIRVRKLKFSLFQYEVYNSRKTVNLMWRRKISDLATGPIEPKSKRDWKEFLTIPPVVKTANLENCSLITLEYQLIVTCVFPFYHKNVAKSATLYIGKIIK